MKGIVPDPDRLLNTAHKYVSSSPRNQAVAMKLAALNGRFGHGADENDPKWIPERNSNGNEIWCIARNGKLITIMFRRSSQPTLTQFFHTDLVVDLTGTDPRVLDKTTDAQQKPTT